MSMGTTGALEANLARTAVDVVIPPEHAALLDIVEPWRGVQDATMRLLREFHHRYTNWAQTLADLHRRAMGDFHYHDGCDRGGEAIRILCDLYATVIRDASARRGPGRRDPPLAHLPRADRPRIRRHPHAQPRRRPRRDP